MKIVVFFFLLFLSLDAKELKKVYFVDGDDINLSIITQDLSNDKTILHIQRNRYLKRVPASKVLQILKQNGYNYFTKRHSYINFIKKSNIDTSALKEQLKQYFQEQYDQITIHHITIIPKQHLEVLPKHYSIRFQRNTPLLSHGNFSIVTPQKYQIFFEYYIDATIPVFITKKKIKKAQHLNYANVKQKNIVFDRFLAMPIQDITNKEAKFQILPNRIITKRDVKELSLVKRGSFVSVVLKDNTLEIDITAKALQGGSLNDIILIQTPRGKKLRAKVIGKNIVEVEAIR